MDKLFLSPRLLDDLRKLRADVDLLLRRPTPKSAPAHADLSCWVTITSTTKTSYRYPGKIWARDEAAAAWVEGETCWVDAPNNATLAPEVYYRGVVTHASLGPGSNKRPVVQVVSLGVDFVEIGTGTKTGDLYDGYLIHFDPTLGAIQDSGVWIQGADDSVFLSVYPTGEGRIYAASLQGYHTDGYPIYRVGASPHDLPGAGILVNVSAAEWALPQAEIVRLATGGVARTIWGFTNPPADDYFGLGTGRPILLLALDAAVTLAHESSSTSDASYRLISPSLADYVIPANGGAWIWRNTTTDRWVIVGTVPGGTANAIGYFDSSGKPASSANLTYASDLLTIGNGGTLVTTATSAPSSIPSNSIAGPFLTD